MFELSEPPIRPIGDVIVRLSTSAWRDSRNGVHFKKSINFLTSKSDPDGVDYALYDIGESGPDWFFKNLKEFQKHKNGLYKLVICNTTTDWETGYCDGHDWKLIEYKQNEI